MTSLSIRTLQIIPQPNTKFEPFVYKICTKLSFLHKKRNALIRKRSRYYSIIMV